jgi:fructose-1,6-bisphosphatase
LFREPLKPSVLWSQLSFKFIVRAVRKAGIADLYGLANTQNSSGDDVKKVGAFLPVIWKA